MQYEFIRWYLQEKIGRFVELWARQQKRIEQSGKQETDQEFMDRLERKFLEMVVTERLKISKRLVRRMEDRIRRTKRKREWTEFGWTMHGHFASIRSDVFSLTDDSGLATELLGEIDHGGRHDPPWEYIAVPLVSAGKAEARGSDRLASDCPQSEPLACQPASRRVVLPIVPIRHAVLLILLILPFARRVGGSD
jgi:hypothetical protein